MHISWRDCLEWKHEGLSLSTTSNEAAKLYDAVLSQYVSWYDEPSVGGIEESINKMIQADENFVLGHVLKYGLDLIGTGRTIRNDANFANDIKTLVTSAEKINELSSREKQHVNALDLFARGKMSSACQVWEDILIDHPNDLLAVKLAHDAYFYLGNSCQIRDSVSRVLPLWKKDTPLYSYLHGMVSFGFEETNLYDSAEKHARKALELNRHDAWATHTIAHVMAMTGQQSKGIAFMSETLSDWEMCGMLACHNFWHWALYCIEKGEYEEALGIFDSACMARARTSDALLDIIDVCSLLYRLKMEGVNVGNERWSDVVTVCRPHETDHCLAFNDAHIMMAFAGAGDHDLVKSFTDSLQEYVKLDEDQSKVHKEVGQRLCQAINLFTLEQYSDVVELLHPIRYRIINIGGSHAQRDIFNQLLINSALNSSKKEHHKLGRLLLNERKALKNNSLLTDRLISRAMALHD